MPDALAVFLETFSPRRICYDCLTKLLGDPAEVIKQKLAILDRSGRVHISRAVCLNCDRVRRTVRVRPGQTIGEIA